MGGTKVGCDGPRFGGFGGFPEISGLAPVRGLPIPGIIINTHVMFLNACVSSLEDNFRHILTDVSDPEFLIFIEIHEILVFTTDRGLSISGIVLCHPVRFSNA